MDEHWTGLGLATFGLLALCACADKPVDIGEPNAKVAAAGLAAYAGSWDGYVEAHTWEDGTDRVRLTIDAQGNGTMRLGERELIPPATDPAALYPPQVSPTPSGTGPVSGPFAGFAYPLHNVNLEAERLRLNVSDADLFASYCALQTPCLDEVNGGYVCVPNRAMVGGKDANGNAQCFILDRAPVVGEDLALVPKTKFSCEQVGMCAGGCRCTAAGCTGGSSSTPLDLDGALEDNQQKLTGSLGGVTVHLNRL